jgi:hypothetical protein
MEYGWLACPWQDCFKPHVPLQDGYVVIWGEVMDARGCVAHPNPISSIDGARKVVALAATAGSNPREVR